MIWPPTCSDFPSFLDFWLDIQPPGTHPLLAIAKLLELVSGRRIEDAYSICGFSIHEYIRYGDEEGSKLRCKAAKLFATYVYSEMIR